MAEVSIAVDLRKADVLLRCGLTLCGLDLSDHSAAHD